MLCELFEFQKEQITWCMLFTWCMLWVKFSDRLQSQRDNNAVGLVHHAASTLLFESVISGDNHLWFDFFRLDKSWNKFIRSFDYSYMIRRRFRILLCFGLVTISCSKFHEVSVLCEGKSYCIRSYKSDQQDQCCKLGTSFSRHLNPANKEQEKSLIFS